MMYKAKVAVCSDIRTKHWTQSENFWMLNLVVRKETARLKRLIKHKDNFVFSLPYIQYNRLRLWTVGN